MQLPPLSAHYSDTEVQEHYRTGCWTSETLTQVLRRQAAERGAKAFVSEGAVSLTYLEVYELSGRLARGLRDAGVGAGDRVAVQLPNWWEFVVVVAAVSRLGAISIPIMPVYRRGEVGHILDDADVAAVVTPREYKGFDYLGMHRDLAAGRPGLHTIIVVRGEEVGEHSDEAHPAVRPLRSVYAAPAGPVDLTDERTSTADDPFVIVYTSGTTSQPKGCVHTFNTYACNARALGLAVGYTEHDVQFGPSPITHSTGLITSVLLPALHGAASHLLPEWEPDRALEEVRRRRCTVSVTATSFLQMLLDVHDPARHDASALRVWVCAGSPIPPSVVERARESLPDVDVLSLYGRSENLTTTTCTVEAPERSLTSDGAATPFCEVRIVDEAGETVATGVEGDIAFRGPTHMLGYLNRPEETAELYTSAGFSRSGDLGRGDADGYVRVTGRTKDIIIRGGMNISVREVEDLLLTHPAVQDVAVVAMPDRRLGERACCYLVPADAAAPPALATLRDFLTDSGIAVRKAPERLQIVDALPRTATGKVQKHLLRLEVAARLQAEETPGGQADA